MTKPHGTNPRAVRRQRDEAAKLERQERIEERRARRRPTVLPPGVEPQENRGPGNLSDALGTEIRRLGLRGYHTYDARRSSQGFPDWTIPTPSVVVFVEQKAAGGWLTYEQAAWLWALHGSGRLCIAAEGLDGLHVTVRLLERLARGDGLPPKVSATVGPWGTSERMVEQLGRRPEIVR